MGPATRRSSSSALVVAVRGLTPTARGWVLVERRILERAGSALVGTDVASFLITTSFGKLERYMRVLLI